MNIRYPDAVLDGLSVPERQHDWLRAGLALLEDERAFVMVSVVGPIDHRLFGCRVLYEARGNSFHASSDTLADIEKSLSEDIDEVWESRGTMLVDVSADSSTESRPLRVFLSWYGPSPSAWVFGAGHIAQALAPLLLGLGYRVVVADDRPEYVTPERFPDPCVRRVADMASLASECSLESHNWVVLVTRGHEHDEQILRKLQHASLSYVGMIGSKRRVATVRSRLGTDGVAPSFIESICAPIGLPIGADSPAEIALSIASEMVAVRRGVHRSSLDHRTLSAPRADTSGFGDLWERAAQVRDSGRPVVLATIIARRGSAPRGIGAQMAVFADGSIAGTIGGGCGEETIKSAAKRIMLGHEAGQLIDVDLTGGAASESSDICGGRYSVALELIS